ncbi:hypothetical protein AEGHOMDF_3370 [Methylobacterium soli]|nr:hypothetical protein AEGHOMDF_3370 [Methylobacterium soli]
MVAFSASRFVWSAIDRITVTTSPIFSAAEVRPETIAPASSARRTATSDAIFASVAWRLSSSMEAANSSAPAATAWTLPEVRAAASAVTTAWLLTSDMACVIAPRSTSIMRWPSARRRRSVTCCVTSLANFTTAQGLPSQSRTGL